MAKGKNAAALFEVIDRGKTADGAPAATRTPNWWWKRPKQTIAVSIPPPPGTSVAPITAPPAISHGPAVVIDHDHHLVRFTVSTSTSIVVAFAVLVSIGIAFLFGEHVGRKLGPMTAITSEELMKTAPNPNVMQVPPGAGSPSGQSETVPPADQNAQPPADQNPSPPAAVDRQAGLNYVIMQSYPPEMKSLATEAQTALLLHGVPCTIEPAPARLHLGKEWISVIGTQGFSSISSSEFHTYVRHIDQANADLHGKFKKLRPLAYKWR